MTTNEILQTLPEQDREEVRRKMAEIESVIRSSKYGLTACGLVWAEIQEDVELIDTVFANEQPA